MESFFARAGLFFGWTLEIHPTGAGYTFDFFALPAMLFWGGGGGFKSGG